MGTIKTVYRGYVCSPAADPSSQKGNESLTPSISQEIVFGDFDSQGDVIAEFGKYLDNFVKQNPKTQIPQLKIVQYFVDENNLDVFYYNSPGQGDATPMAERSGKYS